MAQNVWLWSGPWLCSWHTYGKEQKLIPFLIQNTFFFFIFILLFSKSFHGSSNPREQDIGQEKSHALTSQYLKLTNLGILKEIWPNHRDHEDLTLSFVEENVSIWIICILCFVFIKVYFCVFTDFSCVFSRFS